MSDKGAIKCRVYRLRKGEPGPFKFLGFVEGPDWETCRGVAWEIFKDESGAMLGVCTPGLDLNDPAAWVTK